MCYKRFSLALGFNAGKSLRHSPHSCSSSSFLLRSLTLYTSLLLPPTAATSKGLAHTLSLDVYGLRSSPCKCQIPDKAPQPSPCQWPMLHKARAIANSQYLTKPSLAIILTEILYITRTPTFLGSGSLLIPLAPPPFLFPSSVVIAHFVATMSLPGKTHCRAEMMPFKCKETN